MKILVALDDSPYSDTVLGSVQHRHWPEYTQFKLVSVVDSGGDDSEVEVASEEHLSRRQIRLSQKEHLIALCTRAKRGIEEMVPGAIVHIDIRQGKPAREIIEAALDWQADRVLIGAHGHDVCPRYLTGSVSRAVAQHAHCSVEIVRPAVCQDGASAAR